MYFTESEKFVLAIIGAGMLQTGCKTGIITHSQLNVYTAEACAKVGTTPSILNHRMSVDPFLTIRIMSDEKKTFVKKFLYETLQRVQNCQKATFYLVSTLEQSGLI